MRCAVFKDYGTLYVYIYTVAWVLHEAARTISIGQSPRLTVFNSVRHSTILETSENWMWKYLWLTSFVPVFFLLLFLLFSRKVLSFFLLYYPTFSFSFPLRKYKGNLFFVFLLVRGIYIYIGIYILLLLFQFRYSTFSLVSRFSFNCNNNNKKYTFTITSRGEN